MLERFHLADHAGQLCVVWTTNDYSEPQWISHYWPTVARTYDCLRNYFDDEERAGASPDFLLAQLHVSRSIPGEYYIHRPERPGWAGIHVSLIHGGRTQPVHTVTAPIKPPRVKDKASLTYNSGRWHYATAKKWHSVEPCFPA